MAFDPEFKNAIRLLPDDEKYKLILRLLKHDLNLANKLRFELLDTDTAEDKRKQLHDRITRKIQRSGHNYVSPGILLMQLREISGEINEHVYITKDKYGEISLNCLMIRHSLEIHSQRIAAASYRDSYTFCIYIINRIYKIFMLIQKQHEDFHIEFKDDIIAIGHLVGQIHPLMKTAINNGLDVNWLIHYEIPEDITSLYKEIRAMGLLR